MSEHGAEPSSRVGGLPPLAERPTFLVHRLNAELARICNPRFKRLGVDLITSRILVVLLERPSACVGDVVDAMALPQSTVSHQIKRLEAAGLVQRRVSDADNRAHLVALTTRGRRVAVECDAISTAIYERLFDDMPADDMARLVEQLKRMDERLTSLGKDYATHAAQHFAGAST